MSTAAVAVQSAENGNGSSLSFSSAVKRIKLYIELDAA